MNERIRKITGQVLDELVPQTWTTLGYDQIKEIQHRTAELILIEVTDILSTYRGRVVFEDGAEYNYEHPIITIRKHFGVEQ